jgi:YVTN family beta-propeller protein
MRRVCRPALLALLVASSPAPASPPAFVHFESPHVHPLDRTPDGSRLLAVNTAAGRLEVFDVVGPPRYLERVGSVPVGVEPVTVRARTDTEAWVVNAISDSVSIVDLATMTVRATLLTGDEPADVVFAGVPQRAFVSVGGANRIEVYQPASLASPPALVPIAGQRPRALASDGTRVHVAIFEAGNDTTILPAGRVSSTANPYPGDPNPPPNAGTGFFPPLRPGLPPPPPVSLIVRKDAAGRWRDDNGGDWSALVTWDLLGHDLATIDAATLSVRYAKGLMTVPMALETLADGRVLAVGTELTNHIRFEPNLKSVFVRVEGALLPPGGLAPSARFDLNPHLDYGVRQVPRPVREQSVGDPRAVVAATDGARAYVAGMGSNSVAAFAPTSGARLALGRVGQGPTGLSLDPARGRLHVLNRFDASVSVLDPDTLEERARVRFFDPTPAVVRDGRPMLYDTHRASGLGQAACGSCHIDARMDQLAWDLGDPTGAVKPFDQVCNGSVQPGGGPCRDFHPMKGPMLTQTLVGLAGEQPFHWRGDRGSFAEFAGTATALQGAEADFTLAEMQRLEAFLATISFPPNPNRNLDGSLRTSLDGGNAVTGQTLYLTGNLAVVQCVTCHALPNGSGAPVISANLLMTTQDMTIPHLRNMHEKRGFDSTTSTTNTRGFGFAHDGAFPTLIDFLRLPVFRFAPGATGEAQRRDVAAFLKSFENGTHASVGAQATLGGPAPNGVARRDQLLAIAQAGHAQLVAKTRVAGVERGYLYQPARGNFDADLAGEIETLAGLDALADAGAAVTYTLLPNGTGRRAIDRDGDGFLDGDERLAGTDPDDPASFPGACPGGCEPVFGDGFESAPGPNPG